MQALHDAAAKLPRVAIRRPERNQVIGRDTVNAMQSGVFWGYISLIEGLVDRVKAEWGKPMTVIATGGVASLFDEIREDFPVSIALFENGFPTQSGLRALKRDELKPGAVVVDGNAPLFVVVGDVGFARGPAATRLCGDLCCSGFGHGGGILAGPRRWRRLDRIGNRHPSPRCFFIRMSF